MKEVDKMNKDEEARVARENRERLEKVKKENKRRAERMRNENEIRMVVVLQENALLEDKIVAKLQEQEQAMGASNPIIGEKTAPECPVSQKTIHIHILLFASLYLILNHHHDGQVCLDEMIPPRKIFQCRNGHLLCGACR